MTNPTVAFVGLGYIGLPTAVVMANSGVDVTGIDVNEANVERINRGGVTIVEPGLEDELKQAIESGNFRATTSQVHAQTYIIAVPTPFTETYDVDMKYIYSAAEAIAPQLEGDELVILESTSPPLTTKKMADKILELRPDLAADGSENPEGKPVVSSLTALSESFQETQWKNFAQTTALLEVKLKKLPSAQLRCTQHSARPNCSPPTM